MSAPHIRLERVTRAYGTRETTTFRLPPTTLEVAAGTWTAVTGRSGTGKTTLLHLMTGLDQPDGGRLELFGRDVTRARPDDLAQVRRRHMGLVHQEPLFLDHLCVWQNVSYRLVPAGFDARVRRELAARALARFDLEHVADRLPSELSGGERQRVALARAIVVPPAVLVADEPTSNVDAETGAVVIALLDELRAGGAAIVVSSHDPALIQSADRQHDMGSSEVS